MRLHETMINGIETAIVYFILVVCTLTALALVIELSAAVARLLIKMNIIEASESPFITPEEADEHKAIAGAAVLHHFNTIDQSALAVAAAAVLHRFNTTDNSALAVAAAAVIDHNKR